MRSHYCGQVDESLVDQEVTLCGWANRRRDHGGVIFIDLRDREGMVQVVFDPDRAEVFATAERVHVDREHLDGFWIELAFRAGHDAAASGADGFRNVGLAAAVEPDRVGEVRCAELLKALSVGAVTGDTLLGEQRLAAFGRSRRGARR